MEKRVPYGTNKPHILGWSEDFFTKHGRVPNWAEALAGTKAKASALSTYFSPWKKAKLVELNGARVVEATTVETGQVPAEMIAVLSAMIGRYKAEQQVDTEAIRSNARGEIRRREEEIDEMQLQIDDLLAESVATAKVHENENAEAVSAAAMSEANFRVQNERLVQDLNRRIAEMTATQKELATVNGRILELEIQALDKDSQIKKYTANLQGMYDKNEHVQNDLLKATARYVRSEAELQALNLQIEIITVESQKVQAENKQFAEQQILISSQLTEVIITGEREKYKADQLAKVLETCKFAAAGERDRGGKSLAGTRIRKLSGRRIAKRLMKIRPMIVT